MVVEDFKGGQGSAPGTLLEQQTRPRLSPEPLISADMARKANGKLQGRVLVSPGF